MDNAIITLIVLAAVIGVSYQQQRCLFSRLDYMPCQYTRKGLLRAGNNQYTIHHTKLRESLSGFLECNVRKKEQIRTTITDLGTQDMRIMYSPGFVLNLDYDDQLLVEFKVQCRPGQLAFFNVTELSIQDKDCTDGDGNLRCRDYILIDRGTFGTTELCGNQTTMDSVLELQSADFTVFFRSSEETKNIGFEMYAICFEPISESQEKGCFTPSDFNVSVCTGGGSGDDVGNGTNGDGNKRRRHAYANLEKDTETYAELFPGYPTGLRMNKDLAAFHSKWRRMKRQAAGTRLRFEHRNIFFNQTVNYTGNTISVFDPDNNTVVDYRGVLILQTFDAFGVITTYIRRVKADINPHFFGPGPLTVIGRNAYFQLFVIDPRGLIPNEEEEQDLIAMNRPVLNAVSPENDFDVTDPNQTIDFFPFFESRRRRDVPEQYTSSPLQTKRQAPTEIDQTEISESSLFVTLRNLEACNPVLRSQARSTLQVFEMMNETFVRERKNFTIECDLKDANILECDNVEPATLPGKTTCEINGETEPKPCEPFGGSFQLPLPDSDVITKVVVRAINCNGQRVELAVIMN